MISAQDLSPAELAALLHFHADAGVDWLLEDAALDRFAEFAATRQNRAPAREPEPRQSEAAPSAPSRNSPQRATQSAPARSSAAVQAPSAQTNVAMPDEQAIAAARFAAETARSLSELKSALESRFSGSGPRAWLMM